MFDRILIANRGEIALRIMRTCSEMGIGTVAVYTEPDTDGPHVAYADAAVPLPEPSSYMDVAAIVEAAARSGADAVHPGYGFASENAALAEALEDAGIAFIGPPAGVIATMGSKLTSRSVMEEAGVPVLGIAEIDSETDLIAAADHLGYPLIVKASGGGGGRGMRIVRSPDAVEAAVQAAAREAGSAFGNETVYLERFIDRARHVEVQLVGDRHGNVVHLYERECSVQRRFQKVVEEAPAPALEDAVRSALWEAAVAAGRAVGYVGAGTVEFIVGPQGEFAFLEMNTRLQVEHPVTEATTGCDLVRFQIEVAAGASLPPQDDMPPPSGHAIEARLYAEQPAHGFTPSTGPLHRFAVPGGVRVDTGVEAGSMVTHHYDPMLAKVIAHAPSRGEAIARLRRSLVGASIHGVDTNRELLVAVLNDPDFLEGRVDTGFLERSLDDLLARSEAKPSVVRLHAAAAALAVQEANRASAPVLGTVPSGWRNVWSQPQRIELVRGEETLDARYRLTPSVDIAIDGGRVPIDAVLDVGPDHLDVVVEGLRKRLTVHRVGNHVYVDGGGASTKFMVAPRFPDPTVRDDPGAMVARTPGTVVAVHAAVGDEVGAGTPIVTIEAMKMEQSIVAPMAGTVTAVHCVVGDQVAAGAKLVAIDPKDVADA